MAQVEICIAIPIQLFDESISFNTRWIRYIHYILLSLSMLIIIDRFLMIAHQLHASKVRAHSVQKQVLQNKTVSFLPLEQSKSTLSKFCILIIQILIITFFGILRETNAIPIDPLSDDKVFSIIILMNVCMLSIVWMYHRKNLNEFYFLLELKVTIIVCLSLLIVFGLIIHAHIIDTDMTLAFLFIFYTFLIWIQLSFIRISLYYGKYHKNNVMNILCRRYKRHHRIEPMTNINDYDKQLMAMLGTQSGCALFLNHLQAQYCSENLLFLIEYNQFLRIYFDKMMKSKVNKLMFEWIPISSLVKGYNVEGHAAYLYAKFIREEAEFQLNLTKSCKCKQYLHRVFVENEDNDPIAHENVAVAVVDYANMFDAINDEVWNNMLDAFNRYVHDGQALLATNHQDSLDNLMRFCSDSRLL